MTIWLTITQIQIMQPRLSTSHIYKLASIHHWHRLKDGRTVRYLWDDVATTLLGDDTPKRENATRPPRG